MGASATLKQPVTSTPTVSRRGWSIPAAVMIAQPLGETQAVRRHSSSSVVVKRDMPTSKRTRCSRGHPGAQGRWRTKEVRGRHGTCTTCRVGLRALRPRPSRIPFASTSPDPPRTKTRWCRTVSRWHVLGLPVKRGLRAGAGPRRPGSAPAARGERADAQAFAEEQRQKAHLPKGLKTLGPRVAGQRVKMASRIIPVVRHVAHHYRRLLALRQPGRGVVDGLEEPSAPATPPRA